jgi:hypothetical protein
MLLGDIRARERCTVLLRKFSLTLQARENTLKTPVADVRSTQGNDFGGVQVEFRQVEVSRK